MGSAADADASAGDGAAMCRVEQPVEPAEPEEEEEEDDEDLAPRERLAERTSVTRPEERTSRTGDEEPSRPASPAVGCDLPTVHEPVALELAVEVR